VIEVIPAIDQVADHDQRRVVDALGALREDYKTERAELLRLQNEKLAEENATQKANRAMREKLIGRLSWVSFLWLIFTAVIILLLSFGCGRLSDVVATAFITTSLATVLGLWAIGLRYFFPSDNSPK